jgi:hypothetical protein
MYTAAGGTTEVGTGWRATLGAAQITGDMTVYLLDGAGGNTLDTITLVDITDGGDAIYGFITPTNGLAFTRASDEATWTPLGGTTDLNCTFVQQGDVKANATQRVRHDAEGLLNDQNIVNNGTVINATADGERTQTIKFTYDGVDVAETVMTSMAGGVGGVGGVGPTGPGGHSVSFTSTAHQIQYQEDGGTPSPSVATGILLTADAEGFVDPYFKFSGDTRYYDGVPGPYAERDFLVPPTFFDAPYNLRVDVTDSNIDGPSLASNTLSISATKTGASSGGSSAGDVTLYWSYQSAASGNRCSFRVANDGRVEIQNNGGSFQHSFNWLDTQTGDVTNFDCKMQYSSGNSGGMDGLPLNTWYSCDWDRTWSRTYVGPPGAWVGTLSIRRKDTEAIVETCTVEFEIDI